MSLDRETAPVAMLPFEEPLEPRFDGVTYDPAFDHGRLAKQLGRVYDALCAGEWLTLEEIHEQTADPHASISARIRDLRKRKFGGYDIQRRARGPREAGLFEYRLARKADSAC